MTISPEQPDDRRVSPEVFSDTVSDILFDAAVGKLTKEAVDKDKANPAYPHFVFFEDATQGRDYYLLRITPDGDEFLMGLATAYEVLLPAAAYDLEFPRLEDRVEPGWHIL